MNKTLGQIAYEAYVDHLGRTSLITSPSRPEWEYELKEVQAAWEAAAEAVTAALLKKMPESTG